MEIPCVAFCAPVPCSRTGSRVQCCPSAGLSYASGWVQRRRLAVRHIREAKSRTISLPFETQCLFGRRGDDRNNDRDYENDPSDTITGFSLHDLPTLPLEDAPARPGAYCVRDTNGTVQYMGYSKDLYNKLQFHLDAVGPILAAKCQWYAPTKSNPAGADLGPDLLESVLEYWVSENGGIPRGNTSDRYRWEDSTPSEHIHMGNSVAAEFSAEEEKVEGTVGDAFESVPLRPRRTEKRAATNARAYKSSTFRSRYSGYGANATRDDDYVEVDVDPLDPFSPGRSTNAPKWKSGPVVDEGTVADDWIPLAALTGLAAFMWLWSVMGNTLTASSPSLGM